MDNDIENEEWGQETDDWKMDETRKEFISFKDSPGELTLLFTGKPLKGRSKYQKDQFWFPVEKITLMEGNKAMSEEMTLSTSSNQLRKKLTKLHAENPKLFEGLTPVWLKWIGNGMERKYSMGVLAYDSARCVLEAVGKANIPVSD